MSRSRHQHHPAVRSKRDRFPTKSRRRMKPYGLKPFTGYGGEVYFGNHGGRYSAHRPGEFLFPVVSKGRARHEPIPWDSGDSEWYPDVILWEMWDSGEICYQEYLREKEKAVTPSLLFVS